MRRRNYTIVILCILILALALFIDIFSPDLFQVYPDTFSEELKKVTIEDYVDKYRLEKEVSKEQAFLEIETILENYKGNESEFNIQAVEISKVVNSDPILLKCTIIAFIDLKNDNKVIVVPKSAFLIQSVPLDKGIQFDLAGPHCDIGEEAVIFFMGRGRVVISKETAEKNKIDLSTYEEDIEEGSYYSVLDITGEYIFNRPLSFE